MLRRVIGWLRGDNRRVRPALHKTLDKMLASGEFNASQKQAIRAAMQRPAVMRELSRRLNSNAQRDPNVSDKSFDVLEATQGRQHPVLQWLWSNRQTILSIVWTILEVFGIKLPPLPNIGPTNPTQPPAQPPAGEGPQPVK